MRNPVLGFIKTNNSSKDDFEKNKLIMKDWIFLFSILLLINNNLLSCNPDSIDMKKLIEKQPQNFY